MAEDKKQPLNPKQLRFVEEYLVDNNGKNAAIRAGYSKDTAASIASRFLADPRVKEALQAKRAVVTENTKIDAEYVRRNLTEVLHRCLQAKPVVEWDKMAGEYRETGEWQFDSGGANKALELLGKHIGMFQADQENRKPVEEMSAAELLALANELRRRRDQGLLGRQTQPTGPIRPADEAS